MMNIINNGTQFADGDQQDADGGSQYLALEDNQENSVQENTGEVYIFIYIFEYCIYIFKYLSSIMCTHDIYSRPKKSIGGALHNIGIQYRDR